jgi:hypothetical protein
MITLKSLTIFAALLAGGISPALAQNGPATGNEPAVAGGGAGNPIVDYGARRAATTHHRHIYMYAPSHHKHRATKGSY